MTADTTRSPKRTRAKLILALAAINFVLLLFPPLTWIVGDAGIWYFLITGVVGVISLIVMFLIDGAGEED